MSYDKEGVIPISDIREIGEKRKCQMIVVFAIENSGERFTVTTWGKTKKLCKLAGCYADSIHDAVMSGEIAPPIEEPPDKDGRG